MTRFYDDTRILTISMTDPDDPRISFEADFFDAGSLPYDLELDASRVEDVEYLVDQATTYAAGTNSDFDYEQDEDGNIILPRVSVDYSVEVR